MEGQPLLGVLRGLILDGEEQASYNADPSGYMQRAGYDDISADDLGEAVGLVADTLPPDVAQAVHTAAASPDGSEADAGAGGLLDRLASIDADDVPPLDVPPAVELTPDEQADASGDWDEGGDATSFGDADLDADLDDGFDHDTGDDMDADTMGTGFDPFAEEEAEPSLAEAEADGPIDFRDAADVDDDPIDFGEEGVVPDFGSGAEGLDAPPPGMEAGLAAAPAPPGDDELGDDAFGSDATLEGDTTLDDDTSLADDPFAEDAFAEDGYGAPEPEEGDAVDLDADDPGSLDFDQGFGE